MSGLRFPLEPNRLGRMNTVTGADKIQQNLEQIVNTALRERWYEEDMGSYGVSLLFQNRDSQALNQIAFLLESSLNQLEPRAVSRVTVPAQSGTATNTLNIVVTFRVKETQASGRVVIEVA